MKNEYLSYDALQLAAETSFIQWIKEEEGSLASDWKVWVADHPEMQLIVQEARQLVETNLQAVQPVTHKVNTQALWNRIDTSIGQEEQTPVAKQFKLRSVYVGLAIAAALALLILVFPLFSSETEFRSPNGEHIAFTLPDSSTIELNAASSLQFTKKGFASNREVFLRGEAFFEVEKGENFVVNTQLGSVKVLGTSFNVFEREGNFEVQCLTGKVQVSTRDGKERVILLPGETSELDAEGNLLKKQIDIPELATWRKYKFKYTKTPLIEVLEEIKRQYNVKIDFPSAYLNEEYAGSFEGKDLALALEEVLFPMGYTFNIDGNSVTIRKK